MTHRDTILHHDNPDRALLVWESAAGPILVEEMTKDHLEKALAKAYRVGFISLAIPNMQARLAHLRSRG